MSKNETELPQPETADAVPARNAEGIGQKTGIDPMTPSVPIDRKAIDRYGLEAKMPLRIRPIAPAVTLIT